MALWYHKVVIQAAKQLSITDMVFLTKCGAKEPRSFENHWLAKHFNTIYIYSIKVNAFQSIFLQQHSQGCFVFFLSGDFSIVDQVAGDEPDANPVLARGSSAGVGTHNSLLALTSKHIFFWEDIKT